MFDNIKDAIKIIKEGNKEMSYCKLRCSNEYESKIRRPSDIMRENAQLFDEKNVEHGNTFEEIGWHLDRMFPDGITLKGKDAFNIFYNFIQLFSKIARISSTMKNPKSIIHEKLIDSPVDAQCYAAMLQYCMEQRESSCSPEVDLKEASKPMPKWLNEDGSTKW